MQKYLPLKSHSSQLGDDYFRCVSETIRGKRQEKIDECLKLGRKYRRALERQLKDLARLADEKFIEHERKLISHYLELVEHDLKSLRQGDIDRILSRQRSQDHDH
jgi:DNA-binding transcriptional regulator GbsR (MarR family)